MNESAAKPTTVRYVPIGTVHSEHHVPQDTPAQPVYARGCQGRIELLPQYAEGLTDLDGFSHLILIYHFHEAGPPKMRVQPFTDDVERGIFATRHPQRPNPIGLSVVRLVRIEHATLYLDDVDILDGTPLLDIKPHIPRFESIEDPRGGWMDNIPSDVAQRRGRRGYQGGQQS